jgi:[ribosomal protein S18]-alanine N-acetyltransferase
MTTFWLDWFNPWTWWLTPPAVVIAARADDAHELADLHARCFGRGWGADEFERLLIDPAVSAQRLDTGRRTVGFILSRLAADEGEILSVGVDPAERGSGHGRTLLDHHLRRLAGLGIRRLFLEVEAENEPALKLYRKAGFREVGRRPAYYGKGKDERRDALVMARDLG